VGGGAGLLAVIRRMLDSGYSMGTWAGSSGRAVRPSMTYSSAPSDEGRYPVDEAARTETIPLVVPTGFEPVSPP
jgi:hypothetical protein